MSALSCLLRVVWYFFLYFLFHGRKTRKRYMDESIPFPPELFLFAQSDTKYVRFLFHSCLHSNIPSFRYACWKLPGRWDGGDRFRYAFLCQSDVGCWERYGGGTWVVRQNFVVSFHQSSVYHVKASVQLPWLAGVLLRSMKLTLSHTINRPLTFVFVSPSISSLLLHTSNVRT